MRTALSVKTGLGFAVPPEIVNAYDDPEGDGFGEYLYELTGYGGPLTVATAWYYDYTPAEDDKPAYAVFLKSTVTTEYGAGVFPVAAKPLVKDGEFQTIHELADKLGINASLEWLTVVSIG